MTESAPRPRAFEQFQADPFHPSLRFKKLAGYDHIWSVRINQQYRAIGQRDGERMTWVWIGTHNDFDRMFG
jgi:plasmid maintenance system killer protein